MANTNLTKAKKALERLLVYIFNMYALYLGLFLTHTFIATTVFDIQWGTDGTVWGDSGVTVGIVKFIDMLLAPFEFLLTGLSFPLLAGIILYNIWSLTARRYSGFLRILQIIALVLTAFSVMSLFVVQYAMM